MEETPKSVVDVQRSARLFDLVSLETYYGFNLRVVFAEMASRPCDWRGSTNSRQHLPKQRITGVAGAHAGDIVPRCEDRKARRGPLGNRIRPPVAGRIQAGRRLRCRFGYRLDHPESQLSNGARHQRQLSTAIKRARQLALLPYIKGFGA